MARRKPPSTVPATARAACIWRAAACAVGAPLAGVGPSPAPPPDRQQVATEYCRGKVTREWRLSGRTIRAGESWQGFSWGAAFLPEGYPASVTPDYAGYAFWHAVQGLTSYVRGILSSKAIFQGVGVGSQSASALAAVFNFFVRDVAGMVGGIAFAYTSGSSFDANAKQWRLVADVSNDIGMAIELASPLFPGYFLLCACLGSIARAVTGTAAGATGAALTQHFARAGNAADISAKDQSRERAVSLVGMALGMCFAHVVGDDLVTCWVAFTLLTVLHVYANVRAMRSLVLTTLNEPRLELLLYTFLEDKEKVLTPEQVAARETLWAPPARALGALFAGRSAAPIHFAAPLHQALRMRRCDGGMRPKMTECLEWWASELPSAAMGEYIAQVDLEGVVQVVVRHNADTELLLSAYTHALALARQAAVMGASAARAAHAEGREPDEDDVADEAENWAQLFMDKEYPRWLQALTAAGWDTSKVYLPPIVWTATWTPP